MKILWICNIALPRIAEYLHMEASNKEGWLAGLSERLLEQGRESGIELAVAFPAEDLKWVVPAAEYETQFTAYGFHEDTVHPENYPEGLERRLKEIINDFEPAVVHCFGTEYPHALAAARVCHGEKLLIGIQGICTLCAESYLADLPKRVVKRVTFRDFIRKDSILQQKEKFEKRGQMEREALGLAGFVTGRTEIDRSFAGKYSPKATYFSMNETLRRNFYEGCWEEENCEKHSIFVSQGDYPLKGLHYVLRAMPAILEKYPDAKVYVAGNSIVNRQSLKDRIKLPSYGKYLLELIERGGLQGKVQFLGRLSAEEMKLRFLKSHLFVCASSMENSPNSLGEAMLLGVPCVTAQVGGVTSVFTPGQDGLAYPGFGADCYRDAEDPEGAQAQELARTVLQMWEQEEKIPFYTQNARAHGARNHHARQNYDRLLTIYAQIGERK